MTVKVLVVTVIITMMGAVVADESFVNVTSSETNEISDEVEPKISSEQMDQLRFQPALEEAENAANMYEGSGYVYQKPDIPFESRNLDYDGYEYVKPANPMTYPPPQPFQPISTETSFPEASAKF